MPDHQPQNQPPDQPDDQTHTLPRLAARIEQAGLRVPAHLLLDMLRPLDILNAQTALFVQPFLRGLPWEAYTRALSEPANWGHLRAHLEAADQHHTRGHSEDGRGTARDEG